MRLNVYGALRQLSALLEMAPMSAFVAFLITAFTMFKSIATQRNFIIRLTTFNLWDLRLILDFWVTHQKILIAFNLGVAIFIVGKLLFK